jgi:RHS repeat-associated protein
VLRVEGGLSGNGVYYLLKDHLGSTMYTVKQNLDGSMPDAHTGRVLYRAWGEIRHSSGGTPTDQRYTGQRDFGLGLYFYNARFYDSSLGRFISADTLIPNPGNVLDWDRYAAMRNNPLKYTDPTGHRTCTEKQAATGDETCDQNRTTTELVELISYLYGWEILGDWNKNELLIILDAGKAISNFVSRLTQSSIGNAWVRKYLGNTEFHHATWYSRLLTKGSNTVLTYSRAYLENGFDLGTVIHELGHVLDNNRKVGGFPATWFGGGGADFLLQSVEGNPGACLLRFACSKNYVPAISGPEFWPDTWPESYGNNSVADDFAHTFRFAVLMPLSAPPNRLNWMSIFITVLAMGLH